MFLGSFLALRGFSSLFDSPSHPRLFFTTRGTKLHYWYAHRNPQWFGLSPTPVSHFLFSFLRADLPHRSGTHTIHILVFLDLLTWFGLELALGDS